MDTKIIYKKSQIGYFILFLVGIVSTGMLTLYDKWDVSYLVPLAILIIVIVIFHKLTIVIDEEKIYAYFSYNFFRRTMYFKDMNFDNIIVEKVYWYTGIGIRFTLKGWLYNVNIGKAIRITSKIGDVFFVGTNDGEVIKETLLDIKKRCDSFDD